MKKILTLTFFMLIINGLYAQRTQVAIDPLQYIDTAIVYMNTEQYDKADEYYMIALEKIDLLSADFCYNFGKNSLLLGKYAQSIDWLNKYLELKGSRGQYSREVISLLEKAEQGFRNSSTPSDKADINSKFFYQNTIKCESGEKIMCPVCKGQGVIITTDKLGEKLYRQCPYSTNGILTCGEYNLLIQGLLKPKN